MNRVWFAIAISAGVLTASAQTAGDDLEMELELEALAMLQPAQPVQPAQPSQPGQRSQPGQPPQAAQPAPPAPPAPPPAMTYVFGGKGSYLGVGVADVDSERARELKLKDEHGVEITRVEEESPAAKAGLQKGDVVLEYQGQRVEGMEQFQRFVRETPPGRQVKLHISRNGSAQNVTATIGDRKGRAQAHVFGLGENFDRDMRRLSEEMKNLQIEVPDVPMAAMSWRTGALGITAESLSPQLAEFFGVKDGVLVREVNKDSAAEKAGLKAGDVIVKVDQAAVSSPQHVTREVRSKQRDKSSTFPLTVVRNKQEIVLNVTVEQTRSSEWTPRPKAIVTPRPAPRPMLPATTINRFTF